MKVVYLLQLGNSSDGGRALVAVRVLQRRGSYLLQLGNSSDQGRVLIAVRVLKR